MKTYKKAISLLIFAIVLIVGVIKAEAQKTDSLTIESYIFENNKKEKVQAEFGRLKVPENRKKANGKMIELAFVRFKSTSKNPGSPIIYLAGGPGGPGIQTAKYNRFKLFMAMREFGDVIAFDQRGTGQSKPNLGCSERLDLPLDKVLTKESLVKEKAAKIKVCATKWEKKGVDVSAYNTVESANDINDLRIALGAKKISLWGISYGTHLALATIRQHGKYIDRAILAGVEGVDDTLKLPSYTQNLMEELDRRAKADVELSKTIPDFLGLVKKVHKQLEMNPPTVEVTDPKTKKKFQVKLGKFDLQYLVSAYSGSNEAQSQFPKIYHSISKGDYSFLAQQITGFRKGGASSVMSVAMDCASGISAKRIAQIQKEKQTAIFEDAINTPFPGICDAINYRKLGKFFRKPVKSDVPVLFISGTLDGRTPVSNAEFAQRGFKNSSHLIIDGAGHSDPLFLSSPKIKLTMMKFMKKEHLPSVIKIETEKLFKFLQIKSESNAQNTDAEKIDDFIKPFANANHFSGVVLASKDGKVVYERAFGLANEGHNIPNQINTRFGIASVTKHMTKAIAVRLAEEGKLKLNDKLSKFFPDFPNGDKIDVMLLLRHRAGIKHRVTKPHEEAISYTPAKMVEKAKSIPLAFEPDGKRRLYSSAGYSVLARVLEIASGKSYSELLQDYVFEPMKMKDSFDFEGEQIIKHRAQEYLLRSDGLVNAPLKDYSFLVAAGSVFSTARDIYKFGEGVLDDKLGANVKASLIDGEGIYDDNGNTNGFRCYFKIDRKAGYGFVLIANLESGANNVLVQNIPLILQGKKTSKPKVPSPKITADINKKLSEFVGTYKQNYSEFEVTNLKGNVFAGRLQLSPIGKDKFFAFGSYATVEFIRNEKGKVKGLKWSDSYGSAEWSKTVK